VQQQRAGQPQQQAQAQAGPTVSAAGHKLETETLKVKVNEVRRDVRLTGRTLRTER
jgi:hypothetical protein